MFAEISAKSSSPHALASEQFFGKNFQNSVNAHPFAADAYVLDPVRAMSRSGREEGSLATE